METFAWIVLYSHTKRTTLNNRELVLSWNEPEALCTTRKDAVQYVDNAVKGGRDIRYYQIRAWYSSDGLVKVI